VHLGDALSAVVLQRRTEPNPAAVASRASEGPLDRSVGEVPDEWQYFEAEHSYYLNSISDEAQPLTFHISDRLEFDIHIDRAGDGAFFEVAFSDEDSGKREVALVWDEQRLRRLAERREVGFYWTNLSIDRTGGVRLLENDQTAYAGNRRYGTLTISAAYVELLIRRRDD
jgi:hypothetical protein